MHTQRVLALVVAATHGHRPVGLLAVTDHEHVGNLLGLSAAHAVGQRFAALVDLGADARLDYRQSIADLRVKSLLAAPLFQDDEVVGVVYVDRRASGTRFTSQARTDFEAACADLGQLLGIARRAEERESEVLRLAAIALCRRRGTAALTPASVATPAGATSEKPRRVEVDDPR